MSRQIKLIIVAIVISLAYSGLFWGIFPLERQVSWEGHLSGAISGFLWAYVFRKDIRNIKFL